MIEDDIKAALKKAYHLGQTYWQQADSESLSQHKKADATACRFHALVDTTVDSALSEIESLRAERDADAADARRWQFTLWWQDQKPRPARIQDCLSDMHRWARARGALGPNSEELQRATDNAIAAIAKGEAP